jgi:DNA polymerase-3 subunit beta
MKIICSQTDLKTNLSLVSRAVPSRPTHPVLGNVLLVADADKNKINLTAFDLSLGIRTSFPAQIDEGGSITLPAKLFNDIVTRLPEGEIILSYDEDEMEDNPLVSILCLSGKFQLRGMKGEDFPELPTVEHEQPLMLPITSLSNGLQGSVFAASSDETKQVLTGIHLTRNHNSLEFAATDGHRLAVVQTEDEKQSEEDQDSEKSETVEDTEAIETETPEKINEDRNFEITIPARALRELEQILKMAKENESIALYVDEGQVVFELGEKHLTSRKLEGGYPNYNQLIPHQFSRTMVLDRKTLISSLERVAVLADQKNNLVKFNLDNTEQQVTLSVEAKELGNAKESIPAQITGEDLEIGFNIKYLMDGLKALPSNDIKMHFNEANQPIIINPLGGLKMTYLLMPVQITD